jgi:hypothetical protein
VPALAGRPWHGGSRRGPAPRRLGLFGIATVPNFWWQLGGVGVRVVFALFPGWLQTALGWHPPEIDLEPPAPAADGHAHHGPPPARRRPSRSPGGADAAKNL